MSISVSANADGVQLFIPAGGVTPPPTIKVILEDGQLKFEECYATTDGSLITVLVPRQSARRAETGAQLHVEIPELNVEGLVVWPALPPAINGKKTKVSDQDGVRPPPIPALKPDLPDDNTNFHRPSKEPIPAPVAEELEVEPLAPTTPQPELVETHTTVVSSTQPVTPPVQAKGGFNIFSLKVLIPAIIGLIALMVLIVALLWSFVFKHMNIPFLSSLLGHRPALQTSLPHLPSWPSSNHAPETPVRGNETAHLTNPPTPPTPPVAPTETATSGTINLTDLSVPEVVQRAPSPAAIGQEGERRLDTGKADDGLRLLEFAANKGDTHSMGNLAHLYDPAHFKQGGPIPQADEEEAARYYQQANKAGDKSLEADRAKLRESLQKRADDGDSDAPLTLKNYFEGSTQP